MNNIQTEVIQNMNTIYVGIMIKIIMLFIMNMILFRFRIFKQRLT